ncbi:MAG TPA: ribonucleotide-diphosphate reductase subunit beta [Candidatus Dormibacteraeota bacterium]|jgi:ribonucleoside-diphosphate reductase beta chain
MATTADVEKASLLQLADTHIDDVLLLLDHGDDGGRLPSYRELYLRWERQQWKTQDIDFGQDLLDNERLKVEQTQEQTDQGHKTFSSFWIGERQVTVDLVPFVLAVPDEEQKIFLTTQVVDEARHVVFFDRFFTEVLGSQGETLYDRIFDEKPWVYRAYDDIFFGTLARLADELRQDPSNFENLVRGVTVYHILIEGFLALTGQRFTLDFFKRDNIYPGFRAGFTAIMRDESRHISFGTKFLQDAVRKDDRWKAVIQDQLEQTFPLTLSLLEDSDPTLSGYSREEVNEWAVRSVQKRLKVIGVPFLG